MAGAGSSSKARPFHENPVLGMTPGRVRDAEDSIAHAKSMLVLRVTVILLACMSVLVCVGWFLSLGLEGVDPFVATLLLGFYGWQCGRLLFVLVLSLLCNAPEPIFGTEKVAQWDIDEARLHRFSAT